MKFRIWIWLSIGMTVGSSAIMLLNRMSRGGAASIAPISRERMEQAVAAAETGLRGMTDGGFVQWTPTTLATELVQSLNSVQLSAPGVPQNPAAAVVPYVLNMPTGPWQVALVADEAQRTIRIDAYGADLDEPIIRKNIPLP